MRKGGCWIFLSHSSQDIEKVRLIRNEFERLGHNPLAFHLKCLSDKTDEGEQELIDLIKREIKVREWFVFCNSPAAAHSKYVQFEQKYIVDSGKDKIWGIDMTKDVNNILDCVRRICIDIEVFTVYETSDREIVRPLLDRLSERDYSVWTPYDLFHGKIQYQVPEREVEQCTRKGVILVFITEKSVNSTMVKGELAYLYVCRRDDDIIPVIVDNPKIPDDVNLLISKYQALFINKIEKDSLEEAYNLIIDLIDKKALEKAQKSIL